MAEGLSQNEIPPPADETPLAYRAVRSGLWVLASSYWTIGFGFLANIFLTRTLMPEMYGEFALATFYFTLFQLRNKVSLGFAYAQRGERTGDTMGTFLALDLGMGVISFIAAVGAAVVLSRMGYSIIVVQILVIMSFVSVLESVLGIFGAELERSLHFGPSSVISSIALPVSYIPAFALAWTGHGHYSLVSQAVAFSLVSILGSSGYVWFKMRGMLAVSWRFNLGIAKQYLRFGAITGAGNSIAGLVQQFDNFLIGTVSGTHTLGYYDRAFRTAQWPGLLLGAVLARSAIYTYTSIRHDQAKLEKSIAMVFWFCVHIAMPVVLALFLAADDFIPFVYGEQWAPAVPLLRVLLLVFVLRPVFENAGAIFVGIGRPQLMLPIVGLQLAVLLVVGVFAVNIYGALGVAWTVGIALLLSLLVMFRVLLKVVRLPLWELFGLPVIAAVLTLACYYAGVSFAELETLPAVIRIVVKMGWGVVGFGIFSLMLQPRRTIERVRYIFDLYRGRVQAG